MKEKFILTLASAILDDHAMAVNFFTATSLQYQEFNFNNLIKSKTIILKLKYLIR